MVVIVSGVVADGAQASFGIVPGSFRTAEVERDGTIDTRAGSHPFEYEVAFKLNENNAGKPEGDLRDAIVDLPPGFVGDPRAVPRCSRQDFEGLAAFCPGNTQVGVVRAGFGSDEPTVPLFNLVPPPGVAARFGANGAGFNAIFDASVRTGAGYGVAVAASNVPVEEIRFAKARIWGLPPDRSHDPERQCVEETGGKKTIIFGCSSDIAPKPFLTLPTSCGGPLATTLNADSAEAPGEFVTAEALSLDAGENPVGLFGCERLPFEPAIQAQLDTAAASSPAGLRFDLRLPQNEDPEGLATAHLKTAVVTLPPGMTPNPSLANGLSACTPAQIALQSPAPAACPASSKIGNVQVETPLLEHPLPGAVYLAQPYENPFPTPKHLGGSLLALYIAVNDPLTGVVVKLPGRVEIGGGEEEGAGLAPGQLRASFRENPQLPFENLELELFGGPHAGLVTPAMCGTQTVTSDLTPWSSPEAPDKTPSSGFQIDQNCGLPGFAPAFAAGTVNPQAGAHTPFVMALSRRDGEQEFQSLEETLPPGLLATIAGVPLCPEAQANAGTCDAASQIGVTSAAAGEGAPFWVTGGKVYLTGPYAGGPGPFGLSIVVPAVAGPFNLGNVVVRARIEINPQTAQTTVRTIDPIPTSLKGIPLYIRTIDATINRPGFVFNPTNCSQLHVTGAIYSTINTTANISSPFAAANCAALPFNPAFTAYTQAKTSKANGASFTVKVTENAGEANIHKVDLQLPLQLPARLTTLQKACTERQFAANPAGCPEGSVIGTAIAHTPILNTPLAGPAYLVSHGGAAFPDVQFILQGENGIQIVLDGKTDIKKGITYSKFETVPDAPVSSFETILPEGPHSVLAANGNLCTPSKTVLIKKRITIKAHGHKKTVTKTVKKTTPTPLTAPTTITGQNDAVLTQNTRITVTSCPKIKKTTAKKATTKPKKNQKKRK